MLFICAGVILLTLVIASVLLPLLTREKHADSATMIDHGREARIQMLQAGLRTVREEMTDENKEEAVQLIYAYTKRLQQSHITDKSDMKEFWEATIAVKIGLAAERSVAERWLKEHKASTRAAELFLSSLDRVEMLLASRYKIKLLMRTLWQNLKRLLTNNEPRRCRCLRIIRIGTSIRR